MSGYEPLELMMWFVVLAHHEIVSWVAGAALVMGFFLVLVELINDVSEGG